MQFYVSKALSRFEMNIAWKTLIGLTLLYLALPIVGLLTQLDLATLQECSRMTGFTQP